MVHRNLGLDGKEKNLKRWEGHSKQKQNASPCGETKIRNVMRVSSLELRVRYWDKHMNDRLFRNKYKKGRVNKSDKVGGNDSR